MSSPLGKKLQIKPGLTFQILNAPEELKPWLIQELAPVAVEFTSVENAPATLVFVGNRAQVDQIVFPLLSAMKDKNLVWLAYPKGTSGVKTDISRDILWKLLEPHSWGPARMIALDDTWSCMRFSRL